MTMPAPPAAQPLYLHTITPPPDAAGGQALTEPEPVNVDALCELFDRSMSAVLYIDRPLNDADKQAVFDGHQIVAEFDAVRGVEALRHATPDELAAAEAAKSA